MKRYFFEELSVGQRFDSASYTIDAADIIAFATRYDPQVAHVDAGAAKNTFFQGLAASGWHTAAITMRLLVDGGLPFADGLVGAGADVTWAHPTRPGDVLTVSSEIVELRPSGSQADRGWVTVAAETKTADGTVVQRLRSRMLVPRRSR